MLFAKLFGGRRQEESADPSPLPVQPRMPPVRPEAVVSSATAASATKPAVPNRPIQNPPAGATGKNDSKGFDPYNSGAFSKPRAWERINRR